MVGVGGKEPIAVVTRRLHSELPVVSVTAILRQLRVRSVVKEAPNPVGLFSEVSTNLRECGGAWIPVVRRCGLST
jgi:hypothetical protein